MNTTMTGVKEVFSDSSIIKSAQDNRQYRGLVLDNGMKVLLVSDSTADKAAASLNVNIGSLSDPEQLPGLAHFCEHMLFLGTEKYPSENEYAKFLSEHSGGCNAWTSGEDTNYQFDVAPEHLSGALDRFAQFFLAPLFTESATDREVNAVNSENLKNLQVDGWRLRQLDKSLADPSHDYSKFSTGNKETLDTIPKSQGLNVREELLKFHSRHYSANIMGLCVLGKDPLDELQTMTVELFAGVQNKNLTPPSWPQNPFGPEQLQQQVQVVPVKDDRSLSILWNIPDQEPLYMSKPAHYLSHLLGHEGPGSVLSELKALGWANSLSAGNHGGAKGFSFFGVDCDLTEDGIEHTDEIVELVFQYLELLRQQPPLRWIFDECKNLDDMHFRFKDKEKPFNYTSKLAQNLLRYPTEEVLSARAVMTEFDPQAIEEVLACLTPKTVRVSVMGKKFESLTTEVERWYGTEYNVSRISSDKLQKWTSPPLNPKLALPPPNDFIPTNFDLVNREASTDELPEMIQNTDFSRVWFKQDDEFKKPKTFVTCEIQSPLAYQDPLCAAMSAMFAKLFHDALNEYAYAADLCELYYGLIASSHGLVLSVRGYSDKLGVLLAKVMDKLVNFDIDPSRFDVIKEAYARSLRNFRMEQPYQHAFYYTTILLSEVRWTKEELQDTLDELTVDAVQAFIPRLLSRVKLETLVYGNVTKESALEVVKVVESSLQQQAHSRPLPASQQRRFREFQLPDGGSFEYHAQTEVHPNTCTHIYLQSGPQTLRDNALLELVAQIFSEPCFDVLRTKEQLGYIVFSGPRRASGVQGLQILVQSDRKPEYVETRIEAFIHYAAAELESLDEDTFARHVQALAAKRLEAAKKMREQNQRYWAEIASRQYCFDRDAIEVAELRKLSKADVIQYFKRHLAADSSHRHKLSVHVTSAALETRGEPESAPDLSQDPPELLPCPLLTKSCEVCSVDDFKAELGLYPLPRPHIPLPQPEGSAKAKL